MTVFFFLHLSAVDSSNVWTLHNSSVSKKKKTVSQNKVNSLSGARQFYDPETASSSGATHVPRQPSTIPSSRTMPCRDSGLPHDTRNIMDISGNVFERLPAREGPPSALFENSKNLASSSRRLRPEITGNTRIPEKEMRREPQNSSLPVPRFQSGGGMLHRTGGTYYPGGMTDYQRFPISKMHQGKFPVSVEFQCWTISFRTEVLSPNSRSSDH